MDHMVSFIAQVDNEADSDRCRYVLVAVFGEVLRGRLRAAEALRAADPSCEGVLFSGGLVAAHFLDASFPADPGDELPEGQEPFLSPEEFAHFDAEGWALVPASLVSRARADAAGFVDDVDDVRLLVTSLGLQVFASWGSEESLVRSWTVPWDVLGADSERGLTP